MSNEAQSEVDQSSNTELVQRRTKVISLENLLIALLAGAPEPQRTLARDMTKYIAPRSGFTPHPLTINAAAQMIPLVERSEVFRAGASSI